MEAKLHKRFIPGNAEIIRNNEGEETRQIRFDAIVFNQWSHNLGGFKERILPEALDGLDLSGVVATRNHNFDKVLARADKGTLKLEITNEGLRGYIPNVPDTTAGNDTLEDIRTQNIDGASFMFWARDEDIDWKFKDTEERDVAEATIKKISRIVELGPVTMPAYPQTTASRSMEESYKRAKEIAEKNKKVNVLENEMRYKELRSYYQF